MMQEFLTSVLKLTVLTQFPLIILSTRWINFVHYLLGNKFLVLYNRCTLGLQLIKPQSKHKTVSFFGRDLAV